MLSSGWSAGGNLLAQISSRLGAGAGLLRYCDEARLNHRGAVMSGSLTPHGRRCSLALAAVLLLTAAANARAQQPGLIQNVGARQTTSLDGLWRIIIDPY